ncbi:LANO_0G07712g1_1 [Lachancea nothofagi CBS 11611]|uniref:DASH complex subunit SPC19 n=1 Tax=Lachancea nothofagi CBS 11611 TaxID=1266666 RepID=A0A1G4KHU6_9SACH|nr:LANO_0G07712g1_1 [Lachancea nothofagi CBS 11611]
MAESLAQCVDSLELSVQCLEKTVGRLNNESQSSNYLTTGLLQSRRVFELVPEYDVQRAKLDLIEEVEPLIKNLNSKLVKNLSKLERERDNLQQTLELNALRLKNRFNGEDFREADMSSDLVIMTSSTSEELEQLKQLKVQKTELLESIRLLRDTMKNE